MRQTNYLRINEEHKPSRKEQKGKEEKLIEKRKKFRTERNKEVIKQKETERERKKKVSYGNPVNR